MSWTNNMQLPEGWIPVEGDAAASLEAELRRELPASHPLHGRRLQAFARRLDRDDILFRPIGGDAPIFWVHLTWSVESEPKWPWTETYQSVADFLERWPREEEGDSNAGAG